MKEDCSKQWEPTSSNVCRWRPCWQWVWRRWPQNTRLAYL